MPHPDPAATDPIRVYVGAVHTHRLMFEVLRWSIRRHTRRTVDVFNIGELLGPTPPLPSKPENRPVTPFSFHRFAVPMLAGWQGRAIYLDSDQLVLRDIAELHDLPMRFGVRLLRRAEHGRDGRTSIHASSVMLLRCDRLRAWSPQRIADDLDSGRYSYPALMKLKPVWLKGSFWRSGTHSIISNRSARACCTTPAAPHSLGWPATIHSRHRGSRRSTAAWMQAKSLPKRSNSQWRTSTFDRRSLGRWSGA